MTEVYESIQRWHTKLEAKTRSLDFDKSSTKRVGMHWVKRFCAYVKKDPDSLIAHREETLDSKTRDTKRKHEEWIEQFILKLRKAGYAPNTIATAIGMIRSFYKANYVALVETPTIRAKNVRTSKVPTTKDVKKMAKYAANSGDLKTRAWMLSQFNSGLANIDLFGIHLNTKSSEFGSIKKQLRKGIVPIHIEIHRQKTGEHTDSFLGPNAIEALNDFVDLTNRKSIFGKGMSERTIQNRIKNLAIRARVATKKIPITPYSFRRAFNTLMKFSGMNEALVERMMGHSIGRVRSAYLATGTDESMQGIPVSKLGELYMAHYDAIDIRKA